MTRGTLKSAKKRGAVLAQFPLGRFGAQHDGGMHFFTERPMRRSERDSLRHCRMPEQNIVDFERRDLLTATVDQFLQATRQPQIPLGIDPPLVAGAKPAVGERGRSGFRVILVAIEYTRPRTATSPRSPRGSSAPCSSRIVTSTPKPYPTDPA